MWDPELDPFVLEEHGMASGARTESQNGGLDSGNACGNVLDSGNVISFLILMAVSWFTGEYPYCRKCTMKSSEVMGH